MSTPEASYGRVKAWKILLYHCLLQVLIRYRNIWNIDINYKPIFMGGLTTASGNFKNYAKNYASLFLGLQSRLQNTELHKNIV